MRLAASAFARVNCAILVALSRRKRTWRVNHIPALQFARPAVVGRTELALRQPVYCALWCISVCISCVLQPFHRCLSSKSYLLAAAGVLRAAHMYGECIFSAPTPARHIGLTLMCPKKCAVTPLSVHFAAVSELDRAKPAPSDNRVRTTRCLHVHMMHCDRCGT